jgi:hypothetical protein
VADITRLRALVEKIKPLADWMKQNKPDNKSLPVYKKDWLFLLKANVNEIRVHGFDVTREKGVTYDGFSLRPVDQKVTKG